ncbi:MAG: hypothetical protein KF889_24055 [Alphaproteobacteria bacterium]|nr:hypothetical protein [Alphaproteobacteria bacterium]MCW5742532.1 hypothetical protein [Alphaproteobacteria bacterium]
MSPIEALRAARQHGLHVLPARGGGLRLVAAMAPPAWVMDALSEHKPAIIALLQPDASGWTGEDWQMFFEERAAILEYEHGLPRSEAETRAREQTETERALRLSYAQSRRASCLRAAPLQRRS